MSDERFGHTVYLMRFIGFRFSDLAPLDDNQVHGLYRRACRKS